MAKKLTPKQPAAAKGRPRGEKKVRMQFVHGHDLQVVHDLIEANAVEGFLPAHVLSGFRDGDAAWLVVFE